MEFRRFQEADYEAVCAFLIALNRADPRHINWNWARFEWMYEHPETDKDSMSAFGLWLAEGRIVGAAIYDMYFGEAFCGALPEYAELYPEILRYARRELRDENGLAVAICDDSPEEIETAKALGFAPIEQTETLMSISLDRAPEFALPDGFSLTEPDPVRDDAALQWLFWQGFDHGEDRAAFEREQTPPSSPRRHLNPKLGLAAVDADGEYAAFCCLWYHPATDYAYVEPVCTVPRHRGKRLAPALLSEAMRRARALGAKTAWVISDMDFYRRLGFTPARHYTFWRSA